MIKLRLPVFALAGLSAMAVVSVAHAEGGYVSAGGSSVLYDDGDLANAMDLNRANPVGAFGSVGYRWDRTFATEIEGGLKARHFEGAAQADNGRGAYSDTKLLMVNARLTPESSGALKPYAGVGAGLALVNTQDHSLRSDREDVAPAGQAMAGFSLDMTDRTSFFAEYRYVRLIDGGADATGGGKDQSHAGFVGLRVRLGDFK